jgi:LPS-assembly protein
MGPVRSKQFDFACGQSSSGVHPVQRVAGFCYAEPCTGFGSGMRPRNLVFITLLALCHLQLGGQTLTNALPPAQQSSVGAGATTPDLQSHADSNAQLPDDPGQEILPIAQPEPAPATGVPMHWEAQRQTRVGDTWTLTGNVVVYYRDYVLHADKVVYHQSTSELEAEGHLQVTGGPNDILINASHGDMRLNMHTGRFYNVSGSQGVRSAGHTVIYSTANPFLFSGRVMLQLGEGNYRLIDGTMTNCRLPHPDWQIVSRAINMANGKASTSNALFEFLHVPVFYMPYLRHPTDETGRESGLLTPEFGYGSNVKGLVLGEQYYWVISRNMDMIVGTEYWSKRGWAPNGDFRYKGPGQDHFTSRWDALLDRGVVAAVTIPPVPPSTTPTTAVELVNQGGVDITALGRKDLTADTRVAGIVEYLSSYVYRLVFNDNYSLATTSEVSSVVSLTHEHNGFIPSIALDRFQAFAGSTYSNETPSAINGTQARILRLPTVRYDVLDRPLGASIFYWGASSSGSYLARSEPLFHARNVGRIDLYPHLYVPLVASGWSVVPQAALRDTYYSISQNPEPTSMNGGTPTINHDSLNRADVEAGVEVRPPAIERDFALPGFNRELRHVIEPEFFYRFVGGIGMQAQNVLLVDTTDIATNTNELGYSLTQRFYLHSTVPQRCAPENVLPSGGCPAGPREWASWTIAQKFFFDPYFGRALISGRRNVFDSTLDLTGVAFLTSPRNFAPITSRLRFEAIDNLRIESDLDFDPVTRRLDADNLYAGYSWNRTTIGVGHSMLNAVDENSGTASTVKSQQVQPYLAIGKQSGNGLNLAVKGGYDFVLGEFQYEGVQATYNWNCCGLTVGYRRFDLGSIRGDDSQWLYSFTLANFGAVPGISRSKSVFRDPTLPPAY